MIAFTEVLRYLLGSFFGAIGFALLTRVPRRALLPSGLIAALVYMVYWLFPMMGISEYMAVFSVSAYGIHHADQRKHHAEQ